MMAAIGFAIGRICPNLKIEQLYETKKEEEKE